MHYSSGAVRTALIRFLFGKIFTGLLGLWAFVLIVRGLPNAEFGAYVTFMALQASLTVFSTLGIEAATERYIPELKVAGRPADVQALMLLGLMARLFVLLIVLLVVFLTQQYWLPWIGLQAYAALLPIVLAWVAIYSALQTALVILEALLQQGGAQGAQTLYALIKIGSLIVVPWVWGPLTVRDVMAIEVGASVLSLAMALILLIRGWQHTELSVVHLAKSLNEHPNLLARMRRFAALNYAAQATMQAYGADYMRFLLTKISGLVETARFGFVYSLYDYVQRYLPATMLIRLIRPVFVAKYVESRDFKQLNDFANIILKLNLLVLVPLLVMVLGAGDVAVHVISKGRYDDTHYLLLAYLVLLVPMSHQWVVSIVANTLEVNALQFRGAILAVLGGLLALLLVESYGAWACIAGAWLSALLYNAHAVYFFRKRGYFYKIDNLAAFKFFGAAVVGAAPILGFKLYGVSGVTEVVVAAVAAGLAVLTLYVVKPFSESERALLNKVLPKPVFVF